MTEFCLHLKRGICVCVVVCLSEFMGMVVPLGPEDVMEVVASCLVWVLGTAARLSGRTASAMKP